MNNNDITSIQAHLKAYNTNVNTLKLYGAPYQQKKERHLRLCHIGGAAVTEC